MDYIPEGLLCARSIHASEEGWPKATLLRYQAGWCSEACAAHAGDYDSERGTYEYELALTTEGISYALTLAELHAPQYEDDPEWAVRHRLLLDAVIRYLKADW